ncbi:RseA family anti-sigma factor [Methylomagnum sp.]
MTANNLKEKLSLLLDDELDSQESLRLFERVEKDSAVRAQWNRYSRISAAMRSGQILMADDGFADRLNAALADEPTILAPTALPRKRQTRERLVTTALAASLALVAVLVAKSFNEYSPVNGSNFLAMADLMGPSSTQATMAPEFQDYLVAHYGTAYLAGAQGMLPSVRLASNDSTH